MNHLTPEQHKKVRNIIRWQRIGCIVVKISETMNISLKEACVALGFLTEEKFDEVFHPEQMV